MTDKVEVLNVNHPGQKSNVDATKYTAMKQALLQTLPEQSPGLTQKQMMEQVKSFLPESIFPGGAKSGWWLKCVQLDLEARGVVVREAVKPLRWYKR
jgi:hypothetical protein